MPMIHNHRFNQRFQRPGRLRSEDGFTILIALGVLAVTSLLLTAVFVAVQGDVHQGRRDLDAKRAYYAAQAGLNTFVYQINQDPNYWDTCANDIHTTLTAVPGATTGVQYTYQPVYNVGYSSTNCAANPIMALINQGTGSLRMKFTGYSGSALGGNQVSRTIVTSFRKESPLDYLWYTVYETMDPKANAACPGLWYRDQPSNKRSTCDIVWANDGISGPMYTQDQYIIGSGATPTFGRSKADAIKSLGSTLCAAGCGSAKILGSPIAPAETLPLPTDNGKLQEDALNHGKVFTGTTNITLKGAVADIMVCPGPAATSPCSESWPNLSLTQYPIFHVNSGSGCSPGYTPTSVSYLANSGGNYYGACGDVYVKGSFTVPVTISAGNDIVIDGNVTTTVDTNTGVPVGPATLGLVAGQFVRVMHGRTTKIVNGQTVCDTDDLSHTLKNPIIDAAILTLGHSFIVDNYNCGNPNNTGKLTVVGAIAQKYRGAVGTGGSNVSTGYVKNYSYDDRLAALLPPYLFDIATAGWRIGRETLCTNGAAAGDPTSCAYQGG